MLIGLVGCGGFGREVMPIVMESLALTLGRGGGEPVFVETARAAPSNTVNGYKVLSEEEFFAASGEKLFNVAISDSRTRSLIAGRFKNKGATPVALRSRDVVVYNGNDIGEGAILCSGSIVTSNARVGGFFHGNLQSYIAHDCVIGDFVTFAPRVCCNGHVHIGDHAYVGTGAVLRQGSPEKPLRIGAGAVIGMGAVITKDVPAGETWVGNPAKPLSRA
jgi:sugar O-acyltransferase (sialic acid O-acetyltransferase NeuD family)